MSRRGRLILATGLLSAGIPALAGKADVLDAVAHCDAARTCRFVVTVRHADAGWDHYANAWEVVAPDGSVLATRPLLHPHEAEQPFTRGLDGVKLPADIEQVTVRARDSVHGLGGASVRVPLTPVAR